MASMPLGGKTYKVISSFNFSVKLTDWKILEKWLDGETGPKKDKSDY